MANALLFRRRVDLKAQDDSDRVVQVPRLVGGAEQCGYRWRHNFFRSLYAVDRNCDGLLPVDQPIVEKELDACAAARFDRNVLTVDGSGDVRQSILDDLRDEFVSVAHGAWKNR